MYTETELVIALIFGIAVGISLMILAALSKEVKIDGTESAAITQNNLNNRAAPFIQIHQSLMHESSSVASREESLKRLKDKVESFKQRNRFYQE